MTATPTCHRTRAMIQHHAGLTRRIYLAGRQLKGERGYKPLRAPQQVTK